MMLRLTLSLGAAVAASGLGHSSTGTSSRGGASSGLSAAKGNGAGCPHGGRASVLTFGADPSGTNDSAPAFRAAVAACRAIYAPAGTYTLRSPEPSGKPQPQSSSQPVALLVDGSTCPSDGRNCIDANCTCPTGDGAPYNMAAGTKNKPCWACHKFLPPPASFVDWTSPSADQGSGGGLIGDGPGLTLIQVVYGGSNTSHLAAFTLARSFQIFRDFSLDAVAANGTGLGVTKGVGPLGWAGIGFRAFSAVNQELTSVSISGFIYGIRIRYTVMASFSLINIARCACGIDMARSYDAFGTDDETSSSGWNAWQGGKEGGWCKFTSNLPLLLVVHGPSYLTDCL